MRPGEHLRKVRRSLGITTRDVEQYSRAVAQAENNEEFYVSNAWLTQIENTHSVPSIFKLYTLSIIYRMGFVELLLLFNIDLEKIAKHRMAMPLANTHLASLEVYDTERKVRFPVKFDKRFDPEQTTLLSRMIESWGEVPIALIRNLDIRRSQYGYVGLKDYMLYPLLPPGSFVQIETRRKKVENGSSWRTEFERPIYFVQAGENYFCSWCELQQGALTLLPHPLSPCSIRRFTMSTEAKIIGQVTAVAMRIVNPEAGPPDGSTEPPKQP